MVAKFATNARGAMLLLNVIQVTESISGSVVPLAMFSFIVSFTYRTRVFLKSFHILVIKCQQSCPLPGGANGLQLSWVSLDFHIPIASKYKTLA